MGRWDDYIFPPDFTDNDREKWELPYLRRVREINSKLLITNPVFQQLDAGLSLPTTEVIMPGMRPNWRIPAVEPDTGHQEILYTEEEPSLKSILKMNSILASQDFDASGVWIPPIVDWTGGRPSLSYNNSLDDEIQPPGWEIPVDGFHFFEESPWGYNGHLRMDGQAVYKFPEEESEVSAKNATGPEFVISLEDIHSLREHHRIKYNLIADFCEFVYDAADKSGIIIKEVYGGTIEKRIDWFRDNAHQDVFEITQDWLDARSKALDGNEPDRTFID